MRSDEQKARISATLAALKKEIISLCFSVAAYGGWLNHQDTSPTESQMHQASLDKMLTTLTRTLLINLDHIQETKDLATYCKPNTTDWRTLDNFVKPDYVSNLFIAALQGQLMQHLDPVIKHYDAANNQRWWVRMCLPQVKKSAQFGQQFREYANLKLEKPPTILDNVARFFQKTKKAGNRSLTARDDAESTPLMSNAAS